MQRRRDKSLPVIFGLISLQPQGVAASFHAMTCVNGPRHDEPVQMTLESLFLYPGPNVFVIQFLDQRPCSYPVSDFIDGFQHNIRAHTSRLPAKKFMLTHNESALFQVFGFVISNQNPGWLFPWQKPGYGQAVNIVIGPIKGTHGDDIANTISKCLNGRFNVGELLEAEVTMFAMRAHSSLDLKANAIVP